MKLVGRYLPHALIFSSSACIMVVELVAGRLVARHLGSSLYTWTSIIGVVLAGMSVGNTIGGILADRFRPRALLGWLFLAASVACLLTLQLNAAFANGSPLAGMHWPARVFLTMLFIFLVPALALGLISPVTAKMALERSSTMGRTIGSVYAWGAVGSIVGTFLTGFWLIAAVGVQGVVLVIALGLALLGLALGPRRWVHALWVALLLVGLVLGRSGSAWATQLSIQLGLRDDRGPALFYADSDYQLVKVERSVVQDPTAPSGKRTLRVLTLDHLVHGYVDLDDPSYLHYGYERVYRAATLRLVRGKRRVSAFFIGGGSYTFPRWMLSRWPGSRVLVAEIDPLVLEANHQALGLPRNTPIRTVLLDARNAVDDMGPDQRFDLIFGDAFNDLSVPSHLVTLEYTRKLAHRLTADGGYLLNVIDQFSSGQFLCAVVNTLEQVFPTVVVWTSNRQGVTGLRDTFVVLGTRQHLELDGWEPGHPGPLPGSVLGAAERATLSRGCNGRVLTDNDAPVENLLLPVVDSRR